MLFVKLLLLSPLVIIYSGKKRCRVHFAVSSLCGSVDNGAVDRLNGVSVTPSDWFPIFHCYFFRLIVQSTGFIKSHTLYFLSKED